MDTNMDQEWDGTSSCGGTRVKGDRGVSRKGCSNREGLAATSNHKRVGTRHGCPP